MNSAAPAVQAAAYQLILNRRVGKYVLPDNVVMVAAGNRESDKGVTYRMPTPLANRFIHLEMKVDFESWEQWAVKIKYIKTLSVILHIANKIYTISIPRVRVGRSLPPVRGPSFQNYCQTKIPTRTFYST